MAVPTSSITIRHIYNEINGTTHAANAQIGSGVTMSSLNAASNTYTSGSANHTGVNTTNNVEATPDTIAEWASYVHEQTFATPTYYARTGTGTSDFCFDGFASATANEAWGSSTAIFYAVLDGTDLDFYMVPDHTQINTIATSETAGWVNTSNATQNFSGNYTSGFTAVKIAEMSVNDGGSAISNLQVSITTAVIDGSGTYDTSISGYTNQTSGAWFTPSATKNMRAPRAFTSAACYSSQTKTPYHSVEFKVRTSDGAYTQTSLNKFITKPSSTSISNNCL